MAITIKGKIRITDKTGSGINYKNLRVLAYDQDPQSDDDYMGMDKVANGGTFSIKVSKTKWDNAFKKERRKPDVYILVQYLGKGNRGSSKGRWVKLYRSNQRTNASGTVVINPKITVRSEKAETCFLPSKHGWNFGNSYDKDIKFIGIKLGNIGAGFCGGMVFSAFDHYNKEKAIPERTDIPKEGDPLFKHLYNRQLTSKNAIYIYHSDQTRLRERGFFINKAYNKAIKICKQ